MATAQYAARTKVSTNQSRDELESMIHRYKGTDISMTTTPRSLAVIFTYQGKRIRFALTLPPVDDFKYTPARRFERAVKDQIAEWEQAKRQRVRALKLIIQAKFEAIAAGVADMETEFLGNLLLPDDRTVAEVMVPDLARLYQITRPALPDGKAQR